MMAVLQDSCEFQSVVREIILAAGLQIEGRKIAINYNAIDIKIGEMRIRSFSVGK